MGWSSRLKLPVMFTRRLFRLGAKPFDVALGGHKLGQMAPTEFATGGCGWKLQTKIQIQVDGVMVWVQVNFLATVIGSGKLPKETP